MGCPLASLARLFHLAAIRPDKSRGPEPPGGAHPTSAAVAPSIRAVREWFAPRCRSSYCMSRHGAATFNATCMGCRSRCRRGRIRGSRHGRCRHRPRSGSQGRHPGEGARRSGRRQHTGRRTGLPEHIVGRPSRRLSHGALRTLYGAGSHGAGVGAGNVPEQRMASSARRRSAGASASAGRNRIPRSARLGLCAQVSRRTDLWVFLHLETIRAPGQATPYPHPVRNAREGIDSARHLQGDPRRARPAEQPADPGQGPQGGGADLRRLRKQPGYDSQLPAFPIATRPARRTTKATASRWRCRSAPISGT